MVYNMNEQQDRLSSVPPKSTRTLVLELLREARGLWRSGEEISSLIGLSRAAVSKHVRSLREQGCVIEAAPRRGYRLTGEEEIFTRAAVCKSLNTRCLGKKWIWLEETDTTNNVAARAALEGMDEGCVVVAGHQSSGRGRKGHVWFSAPRSLAFTIVLRPSRLGGTELTALAMQAVSAAIFRVTGLHVVISQPNDILLEGRKICGVLAESGHRADELDWVVLGIGVNVNAGEQDFLPELRDRAASLFSISGNTVSRVALLRAILEELDILYLDAEGRA